MGQFVKMTIPPFPSQDLAKLVLGYLAEEQLMTAYDEFLQASPYLDALRNEYDRIFMTSLKSILAEYRAVKISVETCRPLVLRKRLVQCSNLLEVVKFLINYVDINKLQALDANEKSSSEKQNISVKINCEVCNSLRLPSCACKRAQSLSVSQHSEVEASSSQNSVEATPLADLPGHYGVNRKKYVKTLEKESSLCYSNNGGHQSDANGKDSHSSSASEQSLSVHNIPRNTEGTMCMNSTVKPTESIDSRPKIEEFNDVFESVVKRNSTISGSQAVTAQKVPSVNTFRDFESGVSATESHSANVPDSSTSENLNVQSFTKDYYNENTKAATKCQLLLQVSNVNDNIEIQTCRGTPTLPPLLPKSEEQKIKILSDVKVGRKLGDEKKPLHFKNATSTPLMQMQTIVINGTPAYKHNAVNAYTKDEIMAMPTLIVVPPKGSSKNSTKSHVKPVTSESCNNVAANISSPSSVLGPLVIDVPNSPDIQKKPNALSDLNRHKIASSNLIKTVDLVKNASAPKDNGATTTISTNTPQGLPPVRKSSSTPRRTSHVRVLDFTTPRRILHETISEQVTSESTATSVEVVLSGSPSITNTFITTNAIKCSESSIISYSSASVQNIECIDIDDEPTTNNVTGNKVKCKGKRDWDADLRALAVAGDNAVQSKPKPKKPKKKKDKTSESNKEKTVRKQISPKVKKTKRKRKVGEDDDEPTPDPNRKPEVPVKPNINIISAYSEETLSKNVPEIISNKTDEKEDDNTETPEADRLSLQNVIGAKLNISDLLETPYKQALYDIQMGTPRFLGPDLPDEPMSDIKIMNIPTPRFLNTPKPIQATPSSYSSRPTDYSSGGSYYKPDDQDYILIPDLNCPVTSSKDEKNNKKIVEKESDTKKSRPVRQCTKNVSYKSSGVGKSKRTEDTTDTASSCSESVALNSTTDSKSEKENALKTPVNNKSRSRVLSESNKKATVKKRQSISTKDKSKTIIKIKSRQTPTKLTPSRRRKASEISKFPSPHKLARKPTLSKEKHVNVQPLVTFPPTKSRRKSSSPRKLHRTKTFNSVSNFRTCSPDTQKQSVSRDGTNTHDSDNEQLALRWSDDGSQDAKAKDLTNNVHVNESEEILQIKEFIQTTQTTNTNLHKDGEGSLQADLIRRGFDVETAKIIERDLLDTPPQAEVINRPQVSVEIVEAKESPHEKTVETDVSSFNNDLQIVQEDEDVDVVELSVHECNEDTANYFTCQHDYTKEIKPTSPITLRDKFSIELCIDEDLTVRLRANTFSMILDQEPIPVDEIDNANSKETEMAVRSICNMYTPIKESIKAQCFEIFDSTLTSLDTPLKPNSPKRRECEAETTVTDIVLEEEKNECKEKPDTKKRKRSIPDDSAVEKKKAKHDTQYLFNSTNIQNIDIETVLKKLHGPT